MGMCGATVLCQLRQQLCTSKDRAERPKTKCTAHVMTVNVAWVLPCSLLAAIFLRTRELEAKPPGSH